jgi:hypothetical protein
MLMESEASVQDDLEHVIKISLQLINSELDEDQPDDYSDISGRSSNLSRRPRTKLKPFDDFNDESETKKQLMIKKQMSEMQAKI